MIIIFTLLILICHYILGASLINYIVKHKSFKFSIQYKLLAILFGMGISTIIVLLLDIFYVPLTKLSFWMVHLLICSILVYRSNNNRKFDFKKIIPKFDLYDLVPIVIILFFGIIPIWRTYYYPPYSYDSMMGIDLISKYAIRDGHISASELFAEIVPRSGKYSNQLFYAPFTMLMQTLYRGLDISFGQIWLGILSTTFWLFFYFASRKIVHPIFAGLFTLLIICAPEFYAYSFILQTDFSNAVFFFVGALFFYKHFKYRKVYFLYLSTVGMFLACWTRTETIFFIPFGSLFIIIQGFAKTRNLDRMTLQNAVLYTAIPMLSVFIWSIGYVKLFLPQDVNLIGQLHLTADGLIPNLTNAFKSMNNGVVFAHAYWGYITNFFIWVFAANIFFSIYLKKYHGMIMLFWIVVLYVVFSLLIVQFPAVSVKNTFRRGFFKFIPLMSFFMLSSTLFVWLTKKIRQWESN